MTATSEAHTRIIYTHTHRGTPMHAHTHTCTEAYPCTHIHARTQRYTHAHTHMHAHTCIPSFSHGRHYELQFDLCRERGEGEEMFKSPTYKAFIQPVQRPFCHTIVHCQYLQGVRPHVCMCACMMKTSVHTNTITTITHTHTPPLRPN